MLKTILFGWLVKEGTKAPRYVKRQISSRIRRLEKFIIFTILFIGCGLYVLEHFFGISVILKSK